MSVLLCMALLAGAADESVDTLNSFIHTTGDGAGIDEFAIEPVFKSAGESSSSTRPEESDVHSAESGELDSSSDTPAGCSGVHFEFALDGRPEPMNGNRPRPAWLDQPLEKTGDVHSLAVAGAPRLTEIEAREALDEAIVQAVRDYVDEQIGRVNAGRRVHITMSDVNRYGLVGDRYMQTRELSVGPMKVAHAQLQFGSEFREEMARRWKEHVVTSRLMRTGLTVAGVMVLLIIAFGFLKSASSR